MCPRRFLRACLRGVLGGAALTLALSPAAAALSPAAPHSAPHSAPQAADLTSIIAQVQDDAALRVRIDHLAPAYLPAQGQIEIRGTVTNRSAETWTTVNLYAFLGEDQALLNPSQLDAAMDVPAEADVGERVTDVGEPGKIETLEPGATASYTVRVPVTAFNITGGGVYWFGVHAIGQSASSPRDNLADGRARTFLPYVPRRITSPVPVSLVVPVIRGVTYAADGSVAQEAKWARSLSPGGRLRDLLTFGSTSEGPLTWLVDPALLDAIARLAEGNPGRALRALPDPPTEDGDPSATSEPGAPSSDSTSAGAEGATEPESASARAATAWLAEMAGAFGEPHQVLTLPYGNIDVAATLRRDPALLQLARAQESVVLDRLDIDSTPAIASPGGYLDAASLTAGDDQTTVLATDQMFTAGPAPSLAAVDDHLVTVTSAGAAEGTPGPGPSLTSVGLRQRILAEAAVRALKSDQPPLSLVLPTEWALDDAAAFFEGLEVDWIDLDRIVDQTSGGEPEPVASSELLYPELQQRRELDDATFDGVRSLIEAGNTLQNLLVDNFRIGGLISEQALTGLSYSARNGQFAARTATAQSRAWVEDLLGSVDVNAAPGVTLSSASGTFVVTIANSLDLPVVVGVAAESGAGITIVPPEPVELAARSRTNVLLEARTTSNRVHNVTLRLTDVDGNPLGTTDEIPIRSAQVSDVIWLIMGTGTGLLFLAIIVRLVRRVRAARGRGAGATDPAVS